MAIKSPLFEMNEKEEFGLPESESFPAEANVVSGVGIIDADYEETDEALTEELDALLSAFNSAAEAEVAADFKRQEEEREKYRLEEEERLSKVTADFNQKRYEEEQKAKAEREAAAEAERLREEAEKQARKENSIVNRLREKAAGVLSEAGKITEKISFPFASKKKPKEEVITEEVKAEPVEEIKENEQEQVAVLEEFAPEPPEEKEPEEKKPSKKESKFKKDKKKAANEPRTPDGEVDWKYIATHDELTKLLNTRAYAEELKNMGKNLGVVFFDINNLKYTNDNFSHTAGNRLITGVSKSISEHFGTERLYRIGGDEFVCLIPKYKNGVIEKVQEAMTLVHQDMKELSKKDPEKITYAVSIGYAFGDGKHEVEDVVKAADAAMYKNKKAYKQSHPQLAARPEEKVAPAKPANYDDGLRPEQKKLKTRVREGYISPDNGATKEIVRDIQKNADEVLWIFVAGATFDQLIIITEVEQFVELVLSDNAILDYSYVYAVFEGGPRYYGQSEYFQEVTHLFEDITKSLSTGRITEKEIKNIKGINIFKNIYIY